MNKRLKTTSLIFIVLLFLGAFLRISIMDSPFTEDERKNIIVAKTISFEPHNLNLPVEDKYVTHPLLNVYLTKFGIMLLGDTPWGARLFHLIFGVLTLVVLYYLGRKIGEKEGLIALFLMAVNQFHIHVSVKAENNSLLFFLCSLAILFFINAVQKNNPKIMILLGFICGLAFLTKGVSLLVIAAFFIYLVSTSEGRGWFKKKEVYWAMGVFILTISPWIIWVMSRGSSQLLFDSQMYESSKISLNRTAINFYLIEVFSWLDNIDYRLRISWEDAIVDGITGIILLSSVVLSLRYCKDNIIRLFLILFSINMIVLSFFSLPDSPWGEFWWASLSLIPAICLTAIVFNRMSLNHKMNRWFLMFIMAYCAFNALKFTIQIDENFKLPPRHQAAIVDDDYITAEIYADKKQYDQAVKELERLLRRAPNDIENISYLGWIHMERGETDKMFDQWIKALIVEPDIILTHNLFFHIKDHVIYQYIQRSTGARKLNASFYLGVIHYYNNSLDRALDELNKVRHVPQFESKVHYFRGMIFLKKKGGAQAIVEFKKAIQSDPDFFRAYTQLATCYVMKGQPQQAVYVLNKSLKINPDDARSYDQLGKIYLRLGKNDKAEGYFTQARSVYHDDIVRRFNISFPLEEK